MVIGEGKIVDESLVEVVNAVVEVCIASVNGRWCKTQNLLSKVYRQLDLFCHSMAMAMPPITTLPNHLALPLLVRMVTRGACDRLEILRHFSFS